MMALPKSLHLKMKTALIKLPTIKGEVI